MRHLTCPNLRELYDSQPLGRLHCAHLDVPRTSRGRRICYLKAGVADSLSVAHGTNRSLAQALRMLSHERAISGASSAAWSTDDVVIANAGVHPIALRTQIDDLARGYRDVSSDVRARPLLLWRETAPVGCEPKQARVPAAGKHPPNLDSVAAMLGIPNRHTLAVYNASMALSMGRPHLGHLHKVINREGAEVVDCMHWCLDTAGVVRAWVVMLLQRLHDGKKK